MAENNFSALVQLIVDKAQARTALQRELKELQKEAQLETDVKINLSDVKQARKEIAQANREQQEGTRENIKLRAQELAHARMVAKETKVATDLEIANRQREMKLSNQAMSEELANRKRVAQEQKVATQEELASRESIRKLNEQTFKEESSARRQAIAEMKLQAQEQRAMKSSLQGQADKIQLSTDVTKLTTDYQKFGVVSQQVENNLKELRLAQEAVVNAKGTDRLATEIEKYDTALAKAKSSWKELSATQVSLSQRTSQMTSMQEWMRKNGAATKLCGDRVRELIAECQTCNKVRFDQIKNEFKQIQVEAGKAGKLGSGFLEGLVAQGKKFAQWVGVSGFVTRLGMAVKDTGRNVIELDDALTNISYTMDVTKSQLEDIGNSSLETAINLKTSASNVLDAVKTYANATETAESILNKAKPTIMMSNVSGMDTQQTVDILQGTMEQFDLAEDKLMHISDVMQTVSANMPYDFAKGLRELSEGIQASGSVAKDAGYDLENYTALLGTLIAKTRQSGSELGRSLRTMFVRTTKASSSALANGEVTEEDLSNAEKALRRVGIEVRSDIDTFKSFDEIMGELYNKVDSLSEVDLSNIAYEVASTRQTNVFKMMIKAYGEYQDMAEKAYSADGATLANQEKYAESLKGKLEGLGAVWEKIGDDALDSSLLKGLVDAGTEVSTLIEKFGLLKTAIVGIGAYAGFKNVGRLKKQSLIVLNCRQQYVFFGIPKFSYCEV